MQFPTVSTSRFATWRSVPEPNTNVDFELWLFVSRWQDGDLDEGMPAPSGQRQVVPDRESGLDAPVDSTEPECHSIVSPFGEHRTVGTKHGSNRTVDLNGLVEPGWWGSRIAGLEFCNEYRCGVRRVVVALNEYRHARLRERFTCCVRVLGTQYCHRWGWGWG